jgi:hypothetical protein
VADIPDDDDPFSLFPKESDAAFDVRRHAI